MDKKKRESKLNDPSPVQTRWPTWLTRHQAAARLGKSPSVVQKLQARGYLHPVVKNGISLFALSEVEALTLPGRRPAPWLASPAKCRSPRAKTLPTQRTEGLEAAQVFRLLDQHLSLREIVIRAHVPPHRVRSLYLDWMRSLDQGPPVLARARADGADLDALAAATERLLARND
jgi:hypothetical protein